MIKHKGKGSKLFTPAGTSGIKPTMNRGNMLGLAKSGGSINDYSQASPLGQGNSEPSLLLNLMNKG